MHIPVEQLSKKKSLVAVLRSDRKSWWKHWRELADMYLPRRYVNLLSPTERRQNSMRNPFILDSTGTTAARILASGMMSNITSPSRQWFKLRAASFNSETPNDLRVWLDEVEQILMRIMAESNFYNGLAVMYLDLAVFGTAGMLIYEDPDSIIHVYNPPLGEFYLAQSSRQRVNTVAREFSMTVEQVVDEYGIENCSETVQTQYRSSGANRQNSVDIVHLIEPNKEKLGTLARSFAFREIYWEKGSNVEGQVLRLRGFEELPGIFPRWELTGNDVYGGSPAMDALGDVLQLQQETKNKGQALDKLVRPPLQADVELQHKAVATLANGITFVSGLRNSSNGGAIRPIYNVNPPLGEMTQDILQLQSRIRETFHNDLFKIISQLPTVRSAAEVDGIKEEKLVLIGPVLERFESEALDPSVARIFNTADRMDLLPPMPEGYEQVDLEIQYVGLLSNAQMAVNTASTERFLAVVGQTIPLFPEAKHVPNIVELLTEYGRDIGVPAAGINSADNVDDKMRNEQEQAQLAQEAELAGQLSQGAESLSNTDVGGGINALQLVTGGA